MKLRSVSFDNRRREFLVTNRSGKSYAFPYVKAEPRPTTEDRIEHVLVDKELGNEAFTYVLHSGAEGTIHVDQVLEYNEDPAYLAELLIYKMTLEARRRIEDSRLSRRQVAKRLNTSVPQLYRLLDPANSRKSMNQLVSLLHVLNCNVDVVIKEKTVA